MDPDKFLQVCVGRSQISRVKMLAQWAKGAQNGGENGGSFLVSGTMNSHFFVTGQISLKFGGRNVNRCPHLNRCILKIYPEGGDFAPNRHFLLL